MANWSTLKAAIANVIKANGNQEITGQLLRLVLYNIISSVGENSTFAGIATPDTNPGTPDGPVFYLATETGIYANFNGIEIETGEAVILEWKNESWLKKTTGLATYEELVLTQQSQYELVKSQKELLKRIQGTSDSSSPYYDPFKYIVFESSTSSTSNVWDDFNTWLDELHTTTSEPDVKKAGFFRVNINGQLYEVQNFVFSWSKMEFVQVVLGCFGITADRTIGISQDYSIFRRIYRNGSWAEWEEQNSGASSVVANTMQFSGLVRGDVEDAAWAQKVYDRLNDDQMVEFVIGNAAEEIAGGSVVLTESLGKLIYATDARVAANLGDVLRIAKFNGKPYYSIIPKHGAKAPSGDFPGAYGIMTPNDKMNLERALIPSVNAFGYNTNDCLDQGVYPWCTLGLPAGSTGPFTLIVRKSTSEDTNDYFTIEQTAYGRLEEELGQIWKRLIFQKKNSAHVEYHNWRRIDNDGSIPNVVQETGQSEIAVMSQKAVTDRLDNIESASTEVFNAIHKKLATALQFPTRSGENMNNCIAAGVYPLCTLGLPAGSTGAYTLVVKASTNADKTGYYTVEQTAYGRQEELGQVWQRIIFYKPRGSDTQYGEWRRLDNDVNNDSILPFLWKIENPFNVSGLSIAELNEKFGDYVTFDAFSSVNPLPTCVFSGLGFSCKPTFVSRTSDTFKLWFDFRSFSEFNSSWMCLALTFSEGKQWTGASVTENSSPSFSI